MELKQVKWISTFRTPNPEYNGLALCQRLRDILPHNVLYDVQDVAGAEIDTLFVLEECIKKKIGVATLLRTSEALLSVV